MRVATIIIIIFIIISIPHPMQTDPLNPPPAPLAPTNSLIVGSELNFFAPHCLPLYWIKNRLQWEAGSHNWRVGKSRSLSTSSSCSNKLSSPRNWGGGRGREWSSRANANTHKSYGLSSAPLMMIQLSTHKKDSKQIVKKRKT